MMIIQLQPFVKVHPFSCCVSIIFKLRDCIFQNINTNYITDASGGGSVYEQEMSQNKLFSFRDTFLIPI